MKLSKNEYDNTSFLEHHSWCLKRKLDINLANSWCNKLSKLTGISYERSMEILKEKIDYKQKQIGDLSEKQKIKYSAKRQKIIDNIHSSNPIKEIENSEHAYAIVAASNRHQNTDYEYALSCAKNIRKSTDDKNFDVRSFARSNTIKYNE